MFINRINPIMISDLFPYAYPASSSSKNEEAPSASAGKTYAVMVGISDYQNINDLNYCDDDVVDVKAALSGSDMWKDAEVKTLIDKQATKEGIKGAVQEYAGKLEPEDTFLFFYSGHGTNNNGKAFLCPHDTGWWGGNLLGETELKAMLSAVAKDPEKPPKVAVMIDSCFSGGMVDEGKDLSPKFARLRVSDKNFKAGMTKELSSLKNSVVLTASAADELSYETKELENGLFAYFIAEGLGDTEKSCPADENKDGKVSVEEAYRYAQPKVINFEKLKDRQHPKISDKFEGELDIK